MKNNRSTAKAIGKILFYVLVPGASIVAGIRIGYWIAKKLNDKKTADDSVERQLQEGERPGDPQAAILFWRKSA